MKAKSGFAVLFVFAIALLVMAVPSHALVGPDVRVVSSEFSNDLTPGSQTDLTITLANLGEFQCAYKISSQVQVSSPLSTEGLDSHIVNSFCAPGNITLTFPIKADANAVAASYPITVATTYESEYRAAYAASNTIYVTVHGTPNLSAHVTKTNPVTVYPDSDFSLDITVDNVGAYRADALTLALSSAEAPLEIKSTAGVQSAATLQPRSSVTRTFYLHGPKNTEAKTYGLTLTASYINENGVQTTKSIPLNLVVSKRAVFEASDGNAAAYIGSRSNSVTFTLTNAGSDDAKRLRARLLPSFPFATQGSVQYIEDLKPGQSQEIVFYTDVDSEGIPGTYSLDLSLTWENNDGDSFTDTIPIGIKAEYVPLFNAIFLNYWYVWLIAIAAGAFFYMRRQKAK